jgi:hypothetical protein
LLCKKEDRPQRRHSKECVLMRKCVFEREEEEEDDDKTVNSERMAGAGRRTRTKTASRRVLGSLSVQECSPFLSFSFFLSSAAPPARSRRSLLCVVFCPGSKY